MEANGMKQYMFLTFMVATFAGCSRHESSSVQKEKITRNAERTFDRNVPHDPSMRPPTFPLIARIAYLDNKNIMATITNVSEDDIHYFGLDYHPECYDMLVFDKEFHFKERIDSIAKMGSQPPESVLRGGESVVIDLDLSLRKLDPEQYEYFSFEFSGWSNLGNYKVKSNLLKKEEKNNKPNAAGS